MNHLVTRGSLGLALALSLGLLTFTVGKADEKKEVQEALIKLAGKKGDVSKEAEAISKKFGIEVTMHAFKPKSRGGIGFGANPKDGLESKIISIAEKGIKGPDLAKDSEDLVKLAEVTKAIAQVNAFYAPSKGSGQKSPANWKTHNDVMLKGSDELIEAVGKKDAAAVKAAASKLNSSCTNCHNIFRDS